LQAASQKLSPNTTTPTVHFTSSHKAFAVIYKGNGKMLDIMALDVDLRTKD